METEGYTQAPLLGGLSLSDAYVRPIPGQPQPPRVLLAELQKDRIEDIARALTSPGSCIMLSGDLESDKTFIAHSAAQHFERQSGSAFEYVIIGNAEGYISPTAKKTAGIQAELATLLTRFEGQIDLVNAIVIALDVDRYDDESTMLLERLVRERFVRIICTAHRLTGAADRIARNPEVVQQVVQPLTLQQTQRLLSHLFDVDDVSPDLSHRWHGLTAGNHHALVVLAVSAERRGIVQRTRRTAWMRLQDDEPPADFIEQLAPLTPLEREELNLVAYAMPVSEPALFRILDSGAVNSLLAKHILSVHTDQDGLTALQTRLPVVGQALRAQLSPFDRVRLSQRCFDALSNAETTSYIGAEHRGRLVRFGIESGSPLPVDWMWDAMRSSKRTGDLAYTLNIALAAMAHPDPQPSAEAIMQATTLAHLLGKHDRLVEAVDALDALLSDTSRISQVDFETQAELVVMWVRCHPRFRAHPSVAMRYYEGWEKRWIEQGFEPKYLIQSCRVRSFALVGRARDALDSAEHTLEPRNLGSDWFATSTRTFEALLRTQRGEFRTAIQLAENTRQIMLLNDLSPTSFGDLEGFALFLANWARGTTHSAKQSLFEYGTSRQDVKAIHELTCIPDLSIVLFATQEGRWSEAAELVRPLIESLSHNDPLGLIELAQAAAALIHATLGERREAYAALKHASTPQPGLSHVLYGFVGILSLRARHWLRDPSIMNQARALADWAARQELPLIELEALDIFATEAGASARHTVDRAAALVKAIDQPIGETLLAHIRALTSDEPQGFILEERLLSELGVWLPLPPAESLTGREREVALFTAVGYTSKQIGERLHLSARTVQTHLAHVYAKLSITSREELQNWFASSREHRA